MLDIFSHKLQKHKSALHINDLCFENVHILEKLLCIMWTVQSIYVFRVYNLIFYHPYISVCSYVYTYTFVYNIKNLINNDTIKPETTITSQLRSPKTVQVIL